jgi:hypothetical protein
VHRSSGPGSFLPSAAVLGLSFPALLLSLSN